MTTQPPPWPGEDRPMYDDDNFPPPPPGYGQSRYGEQAREHGRPQPQDQGYGYQPPPPGYGQTREQVQYGNYQPPPPRPPLPAVYDQGQVQPRYYVQPRSVALAVIASFFIPGLGSMINGKVGKGIGILACSFVAAVLCLVLVGFVLAPAVWIWGMVAGAGDAQRWNRDHGVIS